MTPLVQFLPHKIEVLVSSHFYHKTNCKDFCFHLYRKYLSDPSALGFVSVFANSFFIHQADLLITSLKHSSSQSALGNGAMIDSGIASKSMEAFKLNVCNSKKPF